MSQTFARQPDVRYAHVFYLRVDAIKAEIAKNSIISKEDHMFKILCVTLEDFAHMFLAAWIIYNVP
jgi:hypothetical protein